MSQLFNSGCHVLLAEQSFLMQLGSLVIAHGARTYVVYPLLIPYAQDGVVPIATLTCGERETQTCLICEYAPVYTHDKEHAVMQDMSVWGLRHDIARASYAESLWCYSRRW